MKKWWRRQNTIIKSALISGCISIIVALFGLVGVFGVPIIKNIYDSANVTIDYGVYGGERFLYAEDDSSQNEMYDLATNTCLQTKYGKSIIKTKFSESAWTGNLVSLIFTNSPIIITKLELKLIDYQAFDNTTKFTIHSKSYSGVGGGGSPTIDEITGPVFIESEDEQTFDLLLNKAYELPANGSVIFSTPITISRPGKYTFKVYPYVSNYSSFIEPTSLAENAKIEWVFMPTIKIDEIINSGDIVVSNCAD